MAMYEYRVDENVALLTMNNGENRFNFDSVSAFSKVLGQIEKESAVNALVVTSGHEKIWCNGIDLDWLLPEIEASGEAAMNRFLTEMYKLFRQVVTMPMPTIACMNGHAFAGGAFLAFSHDFRFMRMDRGWLCLPEVDLGIRLGPVFTALSKRVLPMPLFEEMQYTARRMTAQECLEYHVITRACALDTLLEESLSFAKGLNKDRSMIRKMKDEALEPVIDVIDRTIASLEAESETA
jgi:enoyl-CoA hydratase/carnithine racemase